MEDEYLLVSKIMQRRNQYLVHCFLYYELDEAIVPDADYWRWCDELIQLQKDHPDLCAELPLHNFCKDLSTDYSRPHVNGVPIAKDGYPKGVPTVALHLLRHHKKSRLSFGKFAEKYGYSIE